MGVEIILYLASVACTENLCESRSCWRRGGFCCLRLNRIENSREISNVCCANCSICYVH